MYINPSSDSRDFGEIFNNVMDTMQYHGGVLRIEKGIYETITEPVIPETINNILKIEAYGVDIRPKGAISGLRVKTTNQRASKIIIQGLSIDQSGENLAISGLHLDGAWHTTVKDCVLTGDEGSGSGEWSAILLEKNATGINALWNKIDSCRIGRRFGSGALDCGIRLKNRSNATTIIDVNTTSVKTGIEIVASDNVMSNGVVIHRNTCENGGVLAYTGSFVKLKTAVPNTIVKSIEISSGRYEKMEFGLDIEETLPGRLSPISKGILLSGNLYDDQTTDVKNPNNVSIRKIAE